ncbi:complement receptor type 1-like [Conger conger]|uniref:complement receptor type 1-like n=1 Tax=Conger conger TaxID=82655 RepID=UPI002A5AA7DA|nr:complement receptor type 1-like [Conger conger]
MLNLREKLLLFFVFFIQLSEGAEITCPSPSVAHGVMIKGDAAVYNTGNKVIFNCANGFVLRGTRKITCGSDSQWQPKAPTCVPSKIINGCRAPRTFPNMVLTDHYLLQKDFPPNSEVRYTCTLGYRRSGGLRAISRCVNKRWTPPNLKCERKSCGSAGEILNGHYEYAGALYGDTVSAVCSEGYTLIGRDYRQCQDQGWDGKAPLCEAVKCAVPPEVVNAERTGDPDGPFVYSTAIHYRCRQGQLIGQREIYCTKNGTWSAPPPECIDVTCPSPSVRFGRMTNRRHRQYKYGDYVSFQCTEGYLLMGESQVMCGRTSQWIPQLPQCERTPNFVYHPMVYKTRSQRYYK